MFGLSKSAPPAGPAVDARGVAAADPTKNVENIVGAAVRRLDDLAVERDRRYTQRFKFTERLVKLTSAFQKDSARQESARIDAMRALDISNAQRYQEVAAAQSNVLADQVVTTAEAARNQVSAQAAQVATGQTAALDPIRKDVADLRQAQYEQRGQSLQKSEGLDKNQWYAAFGLVAAVAAIIGGMAILSPMRRELSDLRLVNRFGDGKSEQRNVSRGINQWAIAAGIAALSLIVSVLYFISYVATHH